MAEISKRAVGGGFLVRLAGVIDEKATAAEIGDGLTGVVVFDLRGVRRMTSFGVREWINALRQIPSAELWFVNCSAIMVRGFNMVSDMGAGGVILTLVAPYTCGSCSRTQEELVDARRPKLAETLPETMKCSQCGGVAEFDDLPDSYFDYVQRQPTRPLSATAQRILNELQRESR